jgi:outer membrane immunogenic protein
MVRLLYRPERGYGQSTASQAITSYIGDAPYATGEGFSTKGAFGGAQAGYNVQYGGFVIGVETDLQLASMKSSKDVLTDVSELTRHMEQNVDWFGSVRGRLGYAVGGALVYATGGLAYAGVDTKVVSSLASAIPVAHYGRNNVETGYTVGGGLEYLITPARSVKAEYQYIDLGSAPLTGTYVEGAVTSNDLDNKYHVAKLGFNYRLGGGMSETALK